LVDQVGDASPQADDWWLLAEHVSGLGMDQHEQCVRTDLRWTAKIDSDICRQLLH